MLSIVIPVFNEEESLPTLFSELEEQVPKLHKNYEIIFIDDGSTDRSLIILKQWEKRNVVRIFSFRKNQGKAEALTLGFQKAKGNVIVTLDADLQDRPSEIAKLLEKIQEGWDVVCGWRKNRQDPLGKRLSSKLFNTLARIFWGLQLHDFNSGLKAYKREVAKELRMFGGMHRFIPLLVHQEGFSTTEIPVVHAMRKFGKSKYGFSKLWKDFPDMFTMLFLSRYNKRPLHFFGTVGIILFAVGIFLLSYLSLLHFQGQTIGRRPLLFLGMLLTLTGLQVLFTGFLADIVIHIWQKLEDKNTNEQFKLKYTSD